MNIKQTVSSSLFGIWVSCNVTSPTLLLMAHTACREGQLYCTDLLVHTPQFWHLQYPGISISMEASITFSLLGPFCGNSALPQLLSMISITLYFSIPTKWVLCGQSFYIVKSGLTCRQVSGSIAIAASASWSWGTSFLLSQWRTRGFTSVVLVSLRSTSVLLASARSAHPEILSQYSTLIPTREVGNKVIVLSETWSKPLIFSIFYFPSSKKNYLLTAEYSVGFLNQSFNCFHIPYTKIL